MIRRSTPRTRTTTAAGVLATASALLAVGLAGQTATAAPGATAARPDPGALSAELSPAQRAGLLRAAEADTAATARDLGLGGKEELKVRDIVKNADGTVHTRYERTYAGLPVIGGDLVVEESPEGEVREVTRATPAKLSLPSTEAPEKHRPKTAGADGGTAPRKIVWAADGTPVLAWERVVDGVQKDGTPSELHIVTDARTGEKLAEYQGVHTGTGESMYSGRIPLTTGSADGRYTLQDGERGGHLTYDLAGKTTGTGSLFTDDDDLWGDGSPYDSQTAAVDAHHGAAQTWDYYKQVHGRDGVRGDGTAPYSRVHYGVNYVNAFWSDDCFCMTYGDGAGDTRPLTSLDVAAHEMTHGLTSHSAGLLYRGESGGLNEATSDIFAAAVEFRAKNPQDPGDYLLGEKVDIFGDGSPLRHMDRPSKDGRSRDYWSPSLADEDVHFSSGVANHFFYLLSEGSGAKTINGVAYDSPTYDGKPVTGVGIEAAERIWFKALTEKMTSTTDYADARAATLSAAADLFGAGSEQYEAVAHAWGAVNVGPRPGAADGGTAQGVAFESTEALAIPDPGTVESAITVDRKGSATAVTQVGVDITHSFRGDLRVELVAPDGTVFRLKNSSLSDSGKNLRRTYEVDAAGKTAEGVWTLRVTDAHKSDSGTLNGWKLVF
ncbi:M4 family metallopeptidase [Streptomyces sp. TRM 70361]|uniref:M4 family metallopeptidase n=1 Tax=Streptomyces sp. TRM 70361 TaxID=3116553 RepID=UPI002E7B31EB|nr:M4 family metallopeptidase [Streptomyces sp. TRM 70361]MEE1938702.1 M4 family metallopeptidase [Streptomyces sp. TRM 70361]